MTYPFLILCLLLLVPGTVIWIVRKDLRKPMGVIAILAVPFAFTEFLFYPTYWEPRFLFNLPSRIGFGIEDFLFVIGLGAFTSTVYPTIFQKRLVPSDSQQTKSESWRNKGLKMAIPIAGALTLTILLFAAGIPIIWGCVPIMLSVAVAVVLVRRDLFSAAIWGGILSAAIYFVICLLFGWIIPDVFSLNWHAENFSNIYLVDVPLEEITYAFAAGTVSSVFYPFVFSCTLTSSLKSNGPVCGGIN